MPANSSRFITFVENYRNLNIGNYYFNEHVHLKFVVVDDTVILSTGNFTETQFSFRAGVKIDEFENMPDEKYIGTFSEVNQYIFLDKIEGLADYLYQHFLVLTEHEDTIQAIEK